MVIFKKETIGASRKMPRKNVPHRVDEVADAIVEKMKKSKKKMSEEKMYDIAYGTAWKQFYKENPGSEKKRKEKKKTSEVVNYLKVAQLFDDLGLPHYADLYNDIS